MTMKLYRMGYYYLDMTLGVNEDIARLIMGERRFNSDVVMMSLFVTLRSLWIQLPE